MTNQLPLSDYVTISVIVPESHADKIREVMGQVGAGETEHYSHGSFSVKGVSRFMPKKGAKPFIGKENVLETVIEERIETICSRNSLEKVVEEIKKAHPYEETVIDIYPIYQIGLKSPIYWKIGKTIVERQEESGCGTKIIEKLAKDIQNAFPGIEGFSRTNIFRMRAFYIAYQNNPPAGGQFQDNPPETLLSIPWRHNSVLVEKLKKYEERMWYAQKTIEHGWSRSVLEIKRHRKPTNRAHSKILDRTWSRLCICWKTVPH